MVKNNDEGFVTNWFRLAAKYGVLIDSSKRVQMNSDLIADISTVRDQNADFDVMYKYEGKTAERSFCKRMMALDKFYTIEEINVLSFKGDNRKLGHKKQNYSIWKYKGGKNCQHHWSEYAIYRDKNGKITKAVNMGKAKGVAGQKANSGNKFFAF